MVLEAKGDGGWQEEATAEQDADGGVEFLLPAGGPDADASYRVTSPGGDGLEKATSKDSPATCGESPTSTTSSTVTR